MLKVKPDQLLMKYHSVSFPYIIEQDRGKHDPELQTLFSFEESDISDRVVKTILQIVKYR